MATKQRTLSRKAPKLATVKNLGDVGVGKHRRIEHTVLVGGQPLRFTQWQVSELAYSAGTSASVTTDIDPDFDVMSLSMEVVPLTLRIGTSIWLDGSPTPTYKDEEEFTGVIDTIEDSYETGTRTIQALSYARVLLNEKVNDVISSPAQAKLTTAAVVRDYTKRFGKGLKAVVDNFTTPVGKIFDEQLVSANTNISVWELFESFAAKDGADLYVKGDTLYYVRRAVDTSKDITSLRGVDPTIRYTWGYNVLKLSARHSPMFSRDVTVTVKSVTPHNGQINQTTATMSKARVAALARELETTPERVQAVLDKKSRDKLHKRRNMVSSGAIQQATIKNKGNYVFVVPNATQEDCDRIASKIMEDIARKEFIVTMDVLGQPGLTCRHYVQLEGAPSKVVNQVYAIKSLSKSFGMPNEGGETQGYVAQVTMVNHKVQAQGTTFGV